MHSDVAIQPTRFVTGGVYSHQRSYVEHQVAVTCPDQQKFQDDTLDDIVLVLGEH